jgi:hypothetical protein
MNLTVRVDTPSSRRLARESERVAARLRSEVERELQAVAVTEQPLDSGTRRDALERAVRRIWGATL